MDDRFEAYSNALQQGHMAALRNRPKDALQHYQQAAKLADERAQPHVSIGSVLLKMGKPKEAVAAYERARERAPRDGQVLEGLAQALRVAGRGDEAARVESQAGELEAEAQQVIGAEPAGQAGGLPRSEMLHLAGHQAFTGGRTDAAIDAWLDEARSHAEAGHLDAALDACQQALSVSPGATRVHIEMARLYFGRGWSELAVERLLLLDRLLELAPEPQAIAAVGRLAAQNAGRDARLVPIARSLGLAGPPPSG